jgi:hypothetical protein
MTRAAQVRFVAPLLALVWGCGTPASDSGSGGTGGAGAGGSATGGAPASGGAGGPGGTGGSPGTGGGSGGTMISGNGGDSSGGNGGNGGSVGVDAAAGGGNSGGVNDAGATGGDDAGPSAPAGGFSCTLLVGPSPMLQWFRGGFLQYPGIDPTKFELISVAHHYTDAWAKPGDSAWNTPLDQNHACAANAMAPDRVAFMATQWSHTTAAEWEADLSGIVNNIKSKWPGVKRIELMASTSAPGNKPCPAAGGKNNETIVPTIGYEAIEAMPAKFPGLVVALPHFEVACMDFIGNGTAPQYAPSATATSGPAVMDVAKVFGTYYAAHP